ncbi:hypothetical protein SLA2020_417600 [Shorea laevis]
MVTVSSKPCLVAPVSTPEVVLVTVSTGFRPVCAEDEGGSSSQSAGQESSPVRPEDAGDQVRQAGSSPMRSEEAGDQFFSLPLDQNMPMGSEEADDQLFSLPVTSFSPCQSSPVRLVDAGDQFSPLDQNTPLDQSSSSPAVGLTAARVTESATLEADPVLGGCLYPLISPEVTEPTVKKCRFRFGGSVSLAGDGLSVRPCNPSAVVIAQKSSV